LIGFVNRWSAGADIPVSDATLLTINKNAVSVVRMFWLITCMLFIATAVIIYFDKEIWWVPALTAILVSQILIILYWKDARWGTIVNAILVIAALIGFANWSFNNKVQSEVKQIFASLPKAQNTVITMDMLRDLPPPVKLWLTNSGIIGKQRIQTVRLKQRGWMRTKPEQANWVEAEAEQYITIDQPAFVWKVKMNMMPLLPVTGRDKFVNGKAQMNIKLFSIINMVKAADAKIDQGALQRFLAEIGWYPSAALSSYIQWEPVDSTTAKATMTYNGVAGSVLFYFNGKGDMVGCSAKRYMGGGEDAVLEKWSVLSKEHASMNGIKMPVKSEATWKLHQGDFTWYKLEITEIEYNKPLLYGQE
jgi:hypothetical protein